MSDDFARIIQAIGEDAFPDDTGVRWTVTAVTVKAPYVCVETEPAPASVGYRRFRFVLGRDAAGRYRDHACYCLDHGRWDLLYTTPDTAHDWRELGFDQ
jgi:hypothetical protein